MKILPDNCKIMPLQGIIGKKKNRERLERERVTTREQKENVTETRETQQKAGRASNRRRKR